MYTRFFHTLTEQQQHSEEGPRKSSRLVAPSAVPPSEAAPTAEQIEAMGLRVLEAIEAAEDPRDGSELVEPFLRLPSRRQYPDYYVVIKRPVALSDVRSRLKQHAYPTWHDLRHDLDTMCNNAKRFNERDSDIWLKARDLHAVIKDQMLVAYDAWAEGDYGELKRKSALEEEEASRKRARDSPGPDAKVEPPRPHKVTLRSRPNKASPATPEPAPAQEPKAVTKVQPARQVSTPPADEAAERRAPVPASASASASSSPVSAPARQPVTRVVYTEPSSTPTTQASATSPGTFPGTATTSTPPMQPEVRRRGAPRGKRLKAMLRWAVTSLMELKNRDDRPYSEYFLELPSRKEYPDYYQFIAQPISFREVESRLDAKSYINPHALVTDLHLMLDNAQFYNEENSVVWEDAQALREHLDNTLIPTLLAEGFTLDPNDHRQAALPPGTPGGVPPPGGYTMPIPTASPSVPPRRPAAAPGAPPGATAMPPALQRGPAPVAQAPSPAPARPSAGPPGAPRPMPATSPVPSPPAPAAPAVPAAPSVAAAPPRRHMSIDAVVRDVERRAWPPHPASFTAPPALVHKDAEANMVAAPFQLQLDVHVARSEYDTTRVAQLPIELPYAVQQCAVSIPRLAASAVLRIRGNSAPLPSIRTLCNGHEAPPTPNDTEHADERPETLAFTVQPVLGNNVLDIHWAQEEAQGHLALYVRRGEWAT